MPHDSASLDRRRFLGAIAASAAMPSLDFPAFARDDVDPARRLLIRNDRPLNAESSVEAFQDWATPVDAFFVRSHFGPPVTAFEPWRLEIEGEVEQPLDLSLDDLQTLPQIEVGAVLQCAGNGRGFFQPTVPGVPWMRGAVGNALWRGPRLSALLERARPKPGAAHIHVYGADAPPHPRTPPFLRSIPLEKALDEATLLATTMNGAPLPDLHGGPLRLVTPGWTGNHWHKWVRTLVVSHIEAPGFYQQTGYRMPRTPYPPGATPPAGELVPVTAMNVKSLITGPSRGAVLSAGSLEAQGVAWTGLGTVERVEVSLNDGPWAPAIVEATPHPYAWRRWRMALTLKPGRHQLRARATDSLGETQPITTPWNRSGYLWNGIDAVEFEVRA